MLTRILLEDDGVALVEYAFAATLVAMATIAILAALGQKSRDVFVQV